MLMHCEGRPSPIANVPGVWLPPRAIHSFAFNPKTHRPECDGRKTRHADAAAAGEFFRSVCDGAGELIRAARGALATAQEQRGRFVSWRHDVSGDVVFESLLSRADWPNAYAVRSVSACCQ